MTDPASSESFRDKPAQHSFRERLEARIVQLAIVLLAWLPLAWVSGCGGAIGRLLFRALGGRRRQTLDNLRIAFGDALSARQRWAVARRCYAHFGALLCEFLSEPRLQGRLSRHIVFDNLPVLDAARTGGRGVVLVSGHFGNWELVSPGLAAAGYPVTGYAGGLRNTLVDDQINAIRGAMGFTPVLRRSGGVRGLLRALRAGQIIALLADQHESTKRHYVAFFGQPVSIAAGPYELARRSGSAVLYLHTVRESRFRYRATFEALPGVAAEAAAEQDLLVFAQRMFALLERDVRAHPDHYFWMHRRFRPIPREVTLSEANRAFLAGRLPGPVESFREPAAAESEA